MKQQKLKDMEKRIYATYESARQAANEFAKENNAYVAKEIISEDDRSLVYADRYGVDVNETLYGEYGAFQIIDNDTYKDVAHFAYMD